MHPYPDRLAAGRVLADQLAGHVPAPCVVAGIPRGGVIVALPVALRLGCPLAVSFVRKIVLAAAPELAAGAIDEDGRFTLDRHITRALGAGAGELAAARDRALAEIRRQKSVFEAPPLAGLLPGATLVLVDDGLATGWTLRAAIAHARRHGAGRVRVAVPYAAADGAAAIAELTDRFVCPWPSDTFHAVAAGYRDFRPVTDDDVRAAIARAGAALPHATP